MPNNRPGWGAFLPRFNIPETFGAALSYEGQLHWFLENWDQVADYANALEQPTVTVGRTETPDTSNALLPTVTNSGTDINAVLDFTYPVIRTRFADPLEWDFDKAYDVLTVVSDGSGNSYTSRQAVPANTPLANTDYWVRTGNYDASLEHAYQLIDDVKLGYARVYEKLPDLQADNGLLPGMICRALGNSETGDCAGEWYLISDTGGAGYVALDNGYYASAIQTVEKNIVKDITKDDQRAFINNAALGSAQGSNTHANVVLVNEDYSLTSAIAAGMCATYSLNGNSDYCEAITLANTYLYNAANLYYGNAYTGTTYEGTYDNPTIIDPKNHRVDGKMPIDCATLTTLIGSGCQYNNSVYADGRTRNYYYHEMYNPSGGSTKPYWKYNPKGETIDPEVGYGRVLTDAQAKMFFDSGHLSAIVDAPESLQVGDIIFSGNDPDRFMKITHCSMVAGVIDYTVDGLIVVDATTVLGVASHTLSNSGVSLNIRAKVSPNYNAGNRLHSGLPTYGLPAYNRNLSTDPITWAANSTYDEICACVVAVTSNTSARRYIHVHAYNGISDIDKDISFIGSRLFFLPFGWSIELSSTETGTFNIMRQRCGTDKAIVVLPRSA